VLIKSILISTKFSETKDLPGSCIQVVILSDTKEYFDQIQERIFVTEKWDPSFTQYLKLTYAQAKFPTGMLNVEFTSKYILRALYIDRTSFLVYIFQS